MTYVLAAALGSGWNGYTHAVTHECTNGEDALDAAREYAFTEFGEVADHGVSYGYFAAPEVVNEGTLADCSGGRLLPQARRMVMHGLTLDLMLSIGAKQ
jgi:hypothetical protein